MDFSKDTQKVIDFLRKLKTWTPFQSFGKVEVLDKYETDHVVRLECAVALSKPSEEEGLSLPRFNLSLENRDDSILVTLSVKGKRNFEFRHSSVPKITKAISSDLDKALRGWNWFAHKPAERLKHVINNLRKISKIKGFVFGDIFIKDGEVLVDLDDDEGVFHDSDLNELVNLLWRRGDHIKGVYHKDTHRVHIQLLGTTKSAGVKQANTGRLLDALERYIYSNLIRPNNSPFSQVLITHEGLEIVPSQEGRSPNLRDRKLIEDWIAENNLPAQVRWRRGNVLVKVATRIAARDLKVTMRAQQNKIQVVPVKRASQRKASVTPQILQDHKIAVKSLDFLNVPFRFGGKSHTVSLSILDNKLEARPQGAKGLIYCQAEIATWDQVLFSFFVTFDYKEDGGAIDVVLALPNKAHKFSLRSFQDFDSVVLAHVQDAMENWSDYMPDDRVSPLDAARKAAIELLRKRRLDSQVDKNRNGLSGQFPGVVGEVATRSPESAFLADLKKWAAEYGQTSGVALEVFSLRDQWFLRLDQRKKSRRAALLPHSALSKWVAQVKKSKLFMVSSVVLISPEEYELTFKVAGGEHMVSVSLGVNNGRTVLIYNPDDDSAQRFVLQGRSPKEIPDLLNAALKESHASWRLEGGF